MYKKYLTELRLELIPVFLCSEFCIIIISQNNFVYMLNQQIYTKSINAKI